MEKEPPKGGEEPPDDTVRRIDFVGRAGRLVLRGSRLRPRVALVPEPPVEDVSNQDLSAELFVEAERRKPDQRQEINELIGLMGRDPDAFFASIRSGRAQETARPLLD